MLCFDGLTINESSGAALNMVSADGHTYKYALKFMFKVSNNEAEYEALLAGVELCNVLGLEYLKAFSDSQLVVSQGGIQGM